MQQIPNVLTVEKDGDSQSGDRFQERRGRIHLVEFDCRFDGYSFNDFRLNFNCNDFPVIFLTCRSSALMKIFMEKNHATVNFMNDYRYRFLKCRGSRIFFHSKTDCNTSLCIIRLEIRIKEFDTKWKYFNAVKVNTWWCRLVCLETRPQGPNMRTSLEVHFTCKSSESDHLEMSSEKRMREKEKQTLPDFPPERLSSNTEERRRMTSRKKEGRKEGDKHARFEIMKCDNCRVVFRVSVTYLTSRLCSPVTNEQEQLLQSCPLAG